MSKSLREALEAGQGAVIEFDGCICGARGEEVRLVLRTNRWWADTPTAELQRTIVLLTGVKETSIDLAQGCAVGRIQLLVRSPLLWDYGRFSNIYGNAPLPDPPKFFFDFFQLVKYKLGSPRDPAHYLNWKSTFSEWLDFVYSRTYCLLRAPAPIAEACTELLDVQAADYYLLPDAESENHQSPLIVVELDRGWLVCEQAVIEE